MLRITLKAARINAGLRQTDAALALDVSRDTIRSWETGKSFPRSEKIEPICNLYGVHYDNIQWH